MTTQEDKNNKKADLPESVVSILKSIASSLADSLTEVKERLFALEVEVRTLAARVDQLEQQALGQGEVVEETPPLRSSSQEAVPKASVLSEKPFQSVAESRDALAALSSSLAEVTRSGSPDAASMANRSMSQKARTVPQSRASSSLQSTAPTRSVTPERKETSISSVRTSKEDKKREKEEILKALRLIDML